MNKLEAICINLVFYLFIYLFIIIFRFWYRELNEEISSILI